MTLNPDCVRDVLLTIEKQNFGEHLKINQLCEFLSEYSLEEISYTCLKLNEGNLLEILTTTYTRQPMPGISLIKDITYQGHEFLSNIRPATVWEKTKNIAEKVGSHSIDILSKISVGVLTELIKQNMLMS